jgi:hypothetical protein
MEKQITKVDKTRLTQNYICILVFIFVNYILVGCEKGKSMGEEVILLKSSPIALCLDSMVYCVDDDIKILGSDSLSYYNDSVFGLVIFTDSTFCSPCAVKDMYKWYEIMDSTKNMYAGQCKMFFIFSSPTSSVENIKYGLHEIAFDSPIFIDTCNVFLRNNPHIPSNPLLHIFTIDKKHNVVMAGSPLRNKERRNAYFQKLKRIFNDKN